MAAKQNHVPRFGAWDANNHVPFTKVFDTARAEKGRLINPNDPSRYLDDISENQRKGTVEYQEEETSQRKDILGKEEQNEPFNKKPPERRSHKEKKVASNLDKPGTHVPQFGKWDNSGSTYTTVFASVRARKGNLVNPNDSDDFVEEEEDKSKGQNNTKYPLHESSVGKESARVGQSGLRLTASEKKVSSRERAPKTEEKVAAVLPRFGEWTENQQITMMFQKYKNEDSVESHAEAAQEKEREPTWWEQLRICCGCGSVPSTSK